MLCEDRECAIKRIDDRSRLGATWVGRAYCAAGSAAGRCVMYRPGRKKNRPATRGCATRAGTCGRARRPRHDLDGQAISSRERFRAEIDELAVAVGERCCRHFAARTVFGAQPQSGARGLVTECAVEGLIRTPRSVWSEKWRLIRGGRRKSRRITVTRRTEGLEHDRAIPARPTQVAFCAMSLPPFQRGRQFFQLRGWHGHRSARTTVPDRDRGPQGGGLLEHLRSGPDGSRLYRGHAMAHSRPVPGGSRAGALYSAAQAGQRARLPVDHGTLGVRRQAYRGAPRIRVA